MKTQNQTNITNIERFRTKCLPHILIHKADMNQTVLLFLLS